MDRWLGIGGSVWLRIDLAEVRKVSQGVNSVGVIFLPLGRFDTIEDLQVLGQRLENLEIVIASLISIRLRR